jgi:hypothetical protein
VAQAEALSLYARWEGVLHTIPLVHSALDGISSVTSTGATIQITTIVSTSTRPVPPTVRRGRWPPNLASSPGVPTC